MIEIKTQLLSWMGGKKEKKTKEPRGKGVGARVVHDREQNPSGPLARWSKIHLARAAETCFDCASEGVLWVDTYWRGQQAAKLWLGRARIAWCGGTTNYRAA
jgi:hypothetical protein